MVPLIAVGRAPVRAEFSSGLPDPRIRRPSRFAAGRLQPEPHHQQTADGAVPRGAIGNRTTAPLVVVLHRSPDGESRFGRAVGARAGGRRNTGTPVRARCQVSPAPQRPVGPTPTGEWRPSSATTEAWAIVGAGRREGLGADVVSGSVHDRGAVQVLTSVDASDDGAGFRGRDWHARSLPAERESVPHSLAPGRHNVGHLGRRPHQVARAVEVGNLDPLLPMADMSKE